MFGPPGQGRDTVVVEQAGGLENGGDPRGGKSEVLQDGDVGGGQPDAGGVEEAEGDAGARAHPPGQVPVPSLPQSALGDEPVGPRREMRIRTPGQALRPPAVMRTAGDVEQGRQAKPRRRHRLQASRVVPVRLKAGRARSGQADSGNWARFSLLPLAQRLIRIGAQPGQRVAFFPVPGAELLLVRRQRNPQLSLDRRPVDGDSERFPPGQFDHPLNPHTQKVDGITEDAAAERLVPVRDPPAASSTTWAPRPPVTGLRSDVPQSPRR